MKFLKTKQVTVILYSGYATCSLKVVTVSAILHDTLFLQTAPEHNISGNKDRIQNSTLRIQNFNINHYLDCLKHLVANEVEADSFTSHQRCTILISVTMRKTILADLSSLDTPSSKSCAALMGILKKRFPPKSLVISERYHFHTQRSLGPVAYLE